MAAPLISPVVREILSKDLSLSADDVIKEAKKRGVTAKESSIRTLAHNIKSALKKQAAQAGKPLPVAARTTTVPKPVTRPEPATAASPAGVLANVLLVHKVAVEAGGVEQARGVAKAVEACGGVEAFLKHLEAVAKIQSGS